MNRTLKEATVRRYYYDSHLQLREHLAAFVDAYNFAKRLKTLNGLTPFEHICKCWTERANRFSFDPNHLPSGLDTQGTSTLPDVRFYDTDSPWGGGRDGSAELCIP